MCFEINNYCSSVFNEGYFLWKYKKEYYTEHISYYHHNTPKNAFHYLINKRPQIDPNEGFLFQLLHYANVLIKSRGIVTTSDTSAASTSSVLTSSDSTDSPIETVQQFGKKKDMQTITKAKLVEPQQIF